MGSNADYFIKGIRRRSGNLDATGIIDDTVDNFGIGSGASLFDGEAISITVRRADANGKLTPEYEEEIIGVVDGDRIVDAVRGVSGTAQSHPGGSVWEIRLTAAQWNRFFDGILADHGQDLKHGAAFHATVAKTAPVDADEISLLDSVAGYVLKRMTVLALKLAVFAGIKPAEGTMWNGKIAVTDTGSGLTLALKTLAETDPSASDPVYITLGGAVRTVTTALSVSKADGTNWCGAGSSEFATKEIDYFAYLGYNATDGVVIGFSRIPYATQYSDFSTTTTNEKYAGISTITNAASTDPYNVIGRFAANLSAGAGYTWSVPTYTAENLIQRPIYNTRVLTYVPTISTWTNPPSSRTEVGKYVIDGNSVSARVQISGTANGSNSGTAIAVKSPFTHLTIGGSGGKTPAVGVAQWTDNVTFDEIANSQLNMQGSTIFCAFTNTTRKPAMFMVSVYYLI